LLGRGETGRPRTPRVGLLVGMTVGVVSEKLLMLLMLLQLLRLREGRAGVEVGVGMLVIGDIPAGRAETPAMRVRAKEKKVKDFIVIVVGCSK
jgi:hypothetical protein